MSEIHAVVLDGVANDFDVCHEDRQAAAAGRDAIRQLAELQAENERLTRWKTEATKVLKGWDALWDELDRHGQLGDARSAATLEHINTLKTELAEYRRRHRTALEALDADRLATIPKRHIRAILKGR